MTDREYVITHLAVIFAKTLASLNEKERIGQMKLKTLLNVTVGNVIIKAPYFGCKAPLDEEDEKINCPERCYDCPHLTVRDEVIYQGDVNEVPYRYINMDVASISPKMVGEKLRTRKAAIQITLCTEEEMQYG